MPVAGFGYVALRAVTDERPSYDHRAPRKSVDIQTGVVLSEVAAKMLMLPACQVPL